MVPQNKNSSSRGLSQKPSAPGDQKTNREELYSTRAEAPFFPSLRRGAPTGDQRLSFSHSLKRKAVDAILHEELSRLYIDSALACRTDDVAPVAATEEPEDRDDFISR